jgi:type II secretory pathway pseudopilin PulG
MRRFLLDKRGQVWVETVIYTLIGLAIIGIVLAGAMPRINQKRDELAIEQSIEALSVIDDKVYEIQKAVGNRRIVSLDVRQGYFVVDMDTDSLIWVVDSGFAYSEIDYTTAVGKINVTTTGAEDNYEVELLVGYSADLRFDDINTGRRQLDAAPTPYDLVIENQGKDDGRTVINFNDA